MNNNLKEQFGDIDIYLFDQLLKGRFDDCKTVLDVGCGGGRNLVYFLQNGYDVHGIDPSAAAIAATQQLAARLNPNISSNNFTVCTAEDMPFADSSFDLVICSAVLHFAQSKDHFESMLRAMWRMLKPGGYLFARLASNIGIEHLVQFTGNGRYLLPDGSQRYLVNEQMLLGYTKALNGKLYEPIKTTNVQELRCMTTWCVQKMA